MYLIKELPMKIRYFGFLLVSFLLFSVILSCKNAPAPVEPEPPVEEPLDADNAPPSQAAISGLDAAAERAARARRLVTDFNGPAYFPSDWNSADSLYSQAESRRSSATVRETRESTARYTAAADALEALAGKTVPQYAQDLETQVMAARNGAVNAGAGYLAPDYLLQADDKAVDALTTYESRDYYSARDKGLTAKDMYSAIETGVNAYKVRLEIEDRGFVRYDPSAIEATDAMVLSALDDYEAGNIAAAQTKAGNALSQYNQSLTKAKESYAADVGAAAAAERQRALDIKANVAVRQDYDAANAIFNRGAASYRARQYDDAANLYADARSMFESVTQVARENRAAAEEALRAAEVKMIESDGTAQQAEMILLEGGAQ
jgi:hypothetical protein